MNCSLNVNDLDQAAVLVALGFDLLGREIVTPVDLNSRTEKKWSCCIWSFADQAANGLDYAEVQRQWCSGLPDTHVPALGVVQTARLAMHNFRVINACARKNAPLWQADLGGAVRLGNWPQGDNWHHLPHQDATLPEGLRAYARAAAVLTACGVPIKKCAMFCGKIQFNMGNAPHLDAVALAAHVESESWYSDPNNMAAAAVAVSAICNRGALLDGAAAGQELLAVSKGGRTALLSKNAPAELVRQVTRKINC